MTKRKYKSGRILSEVPAVFLLAGFFSYFIYGIILLGESNSKARIKESNEYVMFQPSTEINLGRVKAYDFDKDGLLDKVESASFSYRPIHLTWHNIKRDDSLYTQVQEEYSILLENKKK